MVKNNYNIIYRIFNLPALIHEVLHCIPAWCWGLNPRIAPNWYSMKHHRTTDRKTLVITLMPAFIGLLFFPLVWNMFTHKATFYIAATIFWVGWMAACGKDLKLAYSILVYKKRSQSEEE